jgi:hypothetical protein
MLLLDERIKPDGTHARTWARTDGDRVLITDDDGASGALSVLAVDRVMSRYGRPLEHGIVLEGDVLMCGPYQLHRFRYHAAVDAEARDYLVWVRPDGEPLACIATMVTSALRFLMMRLAGERGPQESEA